MRSPDGEETETTIQAWQHQSFRSSVDEILRLATRLCYMQERSRVASFYCIDRLPAVP